LFSRSFKTRGQRCFSEKGVQLSGESLSVAVRSLLSENGKVQAYPDGLVVVGNKVSVLQRVNEMLDQIEQAGVSTWAVQVYFLTISRDMENKLGLRVGHDIKFSFLLDQAQTLGTECNNALTGFKYTALLEASTKEQGIRRLAVPMFHLVDGSSSVFKSGLDINL